MEVRRSFFFLPNNKFAVSSKVYDRFIRVFQKQEKVKMYLASGYCKSIMATTKARWMWWSTTTTSIWGCC